MVEPSPQILASEKKKNANTTTTTSTTTQSYQLYMVADGVTSCGIIILCIWSAVEKSTDCLLFLTFCFSYRRFGLFLVEQSAELYLT